MDWHRRKRLARFFPAAVRKLGPRAWPQKGRWMRRLRFLQFRMKFGAASAKRIGWRRLRVIRESANHARKKLRSAIFGLVRTRATQSSNSGRSYKDGAEVGQS